MTIQDRREKHKIRKKKKPGPMTGGSVSSRLVSSHLPFPKPSRSFRRGACCATCTAVRRGGTGQKKKGCAPWRSCPGTRCRRTRKSTPCTRTCPNIRARHQGSVSNKGEEGGPNGVVRRIRTPYTRACRIGAPDTRKGFQQGRGRVLGGWGVLRQRRTPCTGRVKTQYCQNGVRSYRPGTW